jgi:hypothetical protein
MCQINTNRPVYGYKNTCWVILDYLKNVRRNNLEPHCVASANSTGLE